MIKVTFTDGYQALQPIEADTLAEAHALKRNLETKGYFDIQVTDDLAVKFDERGDVIGLGNGYVRGERVRVVPSDAGYRVEIRQRYGDGWYLEGIGDDLAEIKKIISQGNYCG